MVCKATYEAAKTVAPTVEAHFAQLIATAGEASSGLEPKIKEIEIIIDTAFWASLRREEGRLTKISLALLPPEQAKEPLVFQQRLPLSAAVLTKLAPGVERPGIHLGIWYQNDELYVWGTTSEIQVLCFVLDVSEPGLLVVKHRRIGGFGKFANVAVLKGDVVKIVDENSATLPDCPALLTTLLGFAAPSSWKDSINVLVLMAVSMRAHMRGGTLLVVPAQSLTWRESIIQPVPYAITPAFSGLADLVRQNEEAQSQAWWQSALRREIDAIANLTAIDGATILTDQYELLAFGAKIGRPTGMEPITEIVATEPIIGRVPLVVHPTRTGGTRHLSAAQFVHDQRDSMALVASQDGRFTIFAWSPCEGMVHAHRIDALLL
ncbi:MAG TPA: hypothetical protein VK927_10525 [Adhaeribacter sp.]|nr:hypothetical protein [Adhaeribacter sp.]